MPASNLTRLRITVQNGDLSFVREPLLLGHYRSGRLTGTEHIMDSRIGGAMQQALTLGVYPSEVGACQIFLNTRAPADDPLKLPCPRAVVVVGLGEEGTLTGHALATSVRRAVLAWAQRVVERIGTEERAFDMAATLMGSGGLGVSVGQSAQFIAQGVCEANEALASSAWPVVGRLHFIELYLDRATEAWRALRVQADGTTAPRAFTLAGGIEIGTGAMRRPLDAGYRGANYDIVSAVSELEADGTSTIAYTLNTRRARSEVRARTAQLRLIRQMVEQASSDTDTDDEVRKALFTLLIPMDLEPFLTATTELQLQLTPETAAIPWELLDPDPSRADGSSVNGGTKGQTPWAIRTKLLRTLGTRTFRERVTDADADASVLVIGEPLVTNRRYSPLPGALAEAKAVAKCLIDAGFEGGRIRELYASESPPRAAPDGKTVVKTLLASNWRIIHIAGHGADPEPIADAAKQGLPPDAVRPSRGVVLSGDTFVGPDEIASLRVVPELVFLNCCHLARSESGEVLATPTDRARFAASVASALIQAGVRCVVAAGWAVDDEPACTFATTFYSALMTGQRFIDAVAAAREAAYDAGGNTWAAYQCYGDPDWRFRLDVGDAQGPTQRTPAAPDDEFQDIASPSALELALHTLSVRSIYQGADARVQCEHIRTLEKRFAESWSTMGAIAEAFAEAWRDAGDRKRAIEWYSKALEAPDGGASTRAAEQLGNLCARFAWERLDRTLMGGVPAPARKRRAIAEARKLVLDGLEVLEKLSALHDTSQRASLRGSAFKRLAMIETAAGEEGAASAAIERMLRHYSEAEALAQREPDADLFYPAVNVLAAEVVRNFARKRPQGLPTARIAYLRETLSRRDEQSPDFWTKVGPVELEIYEALIRRDLATHRARIHDAYRQLHERVPARHFWATVHDHLRFVLQRYERGAPSAEQRAARKLTEDIAAWRE